MVDRLYSERQLKEMHVPQIRRLLRERGVTGVWTASATKKALIKAYLDGHKPSEAAPSPADLMDEKIIFAIRGAAELFVELIRDELKRQNPRP